MGVWLGLSGLFCVVHLSGSVGVILGAILLAGTAMVHHHTMLALWGAAAAIALIGMVIVTEHRVVWFRLLVALVCAACLAGIYILPLMRRIGDIKGTMVLNYTEHFDWPWEHFWSWYLVPTVFTLTLLSVSITTVSVWLGIRIRRSGVEPGSRAVLLGVGCLWLLSFCVLDYGCRVYGFIMNRPSVQPFTPSRFMFDVQFVLATIAAGGLVRFWEWLRRPAFRVAVATVIALSAVLQVAPRWQPKPDDLLVPLGKWADQNLPDDSLVISEPAATSIWITYLFHRESAALFIPISEHADIQRIRLKMAVQVQPALLPWSEWRRRLGKPLYLVGVAGEPKMVGPPIFTSRFFAIYDLNRLNNQDWKEGD
jgi:hypothetical protein